MIDESVNIMLVWESPSAIAEVYQLCLCMSLDRILFGICCKLAWTTLVQIPGEPRIQLTSLPHPPCPGTLPGYLAEPSGKVNSCVLFTRLI